MPSEPSVPSDDELVRRVQGGDRAAFEPIMRRYNRRLFRAARAVLNDDAEAEDTLQEGYVRAFMHLAEYEGPARFGAWLTRIVVRESLARLRRRRTQPRLGGLEPLDGDETMSDESNPEAHASDHEMRAVLERLIDALPDEFRTVFVLRAVEDLSVADTAASLEIPEDTVKSRLHRARKILQRGLLRRIEAGVRDTYAFEAPRCDAIVAGVMARLAAQKTEGDSHGRNDA